VYEPTYWCYEAPDNVAEVVDRRGPVTFGCLNNFCKVTLRTLDSWAEILKRVPDSRLILHAAPGSHRGRVVERLGIDASRIEFVGKGVLAEYLATHGRVDIALDPFPYNGGTTTCDAMWMGAGPVTLAGRTAVARAGVSLLSQVGLTEMIAPDVEGYVELAVKLADDRERLAALRRGMRERMKSSPLMDAPAAARAFEAAIRQMWHAWCARAG
jgi:predicted O-linked N-acetylglucosamine transferase (SPINDLY family)